MFSRMFLPFRMWYPWCSSSVLLLWASPGTEGYHELSMVIMNTSLEQYLMVRLDASELALSGQRWRKALPPYL